MLSYNPTKKEKIYKQNQYRIRMVADEYTCQYEGCGEIAFTMAHRIAQTRENIKKYGWEIIQHNFNIVTACQRNFGRHNDYFNIGYKPKKCERLVELIKKHSYAYLLTSDYITQYLQGDGDEGRCK